MLVFSSPLITFLTIVLGPFLAGVILVWHKFGQKGKLDSDLATAVLSNVVALVPIACLIANMVFATFQESVNLMQDSTDVPSTSAETSALAGGQTKSETTETQNSSNIVRGDVAYGKMIKGNEVTFTLAMMYAALLIIVSIYRNLRSSRGAAAKPAE